MQLMCDAPQPRPVFASRQEYAERFADLVFWESSVRVICQRHDLPCGRVHMGVPGTYPTFLVDDRWVVKLFGEWFDGGVSHAVERDVYALLRGQTDIPAPQLVAAGDLYSGGDGWPWPYLVSQQLPGRSLAQVRDLVAEDDLIGIARYTGQVLRRLHSVPITGGTALAPDWDSFVAFIAERRARCLADHRSWGSLPLALIAQIPDYLLPADVLFDRSTRPVLLHADVTMDHLLLQKGESGRWAMTGIIDFGDARVGDPLYELVALHLDALDCDKRLLQSFWDGYGSDIARNDWVRRAMNYALLFPFDSLGAALRAHPALREARSLDDLAVALWV